MKFLMFEISIYILCLQTTDGDILSQFNGINNMIVRIISLLAWNFNFNFSLFYDLSAKKEIVST